MPLATPFTNEVPCARCPLRECEVFRSLSDDEVEFVQSLKTGELRMGPGATLLHEGQTAEHLFTLLEGWAFRYKTLSDGRRQITNFLLPGDFVGLQGSMQGAMEHSVETLSPAAFCTFPRNRVWELYGRCPSLAFDLTWLAATEQRILDENLVERRAPERGGAGPPVTSCISMSAPTISVSSPRAVCAFPSPSSILPTPSGSPWCTPTRP